METETENEGHVQVCILLYSIEEIRDFLNYSYCCKDFTIKSIRQDGQRAFIVEFEEGNDCIDLFKHSKILNEASPTLLGCVPFDLLDIREETIQTMELYVKLHDEADDLYDDSMGYNYFKVRSAIHG